MKFICSPELLRTEHIPHKPSYSLLLNELLFYSADIQFSPELLHEIDEQRQCRYILHDCQLHGPGVVHASLDELLTLPPHLQSKILLMHYGDDMESFIEKTGQMEFMIQHRIYTF